MRRQLLIILRFAIGMKYKMFAWNEPHANKYPINL